MVERTVKWFREANEATIGNYHYKDEQISH